MKKIASLFVCILILNHAYAIFKVPFTYVPEKSIAPDNQDNGLKDILLPIVKEAGFDDAEYYDENGEKTVDFHDKSELFWFSIVSNTDDCICLQLNIRGLKMYDKNAFQDTFQRYEEIALFEAMNETNRKFFTVKVFYDRSKGRIMFCQQIFLRKISDLTPKIINFSVMELEVACKDFEKVYNEHSNNNIYIFPSDFNRNSRQSADYLNFGSDIEEFGKLEDILKGTNGISDVLYNGDEKTLDFTYNKEDYWYTIDSNKDGVIDLKLNRRGLKAKDYNGELRFVTAAVMDAMNEVNQDFFSVKMYYDREKGSIKLCQQLFVKTTAVITPNIVLKSVDEMEKAWKTYGKAYEKFSKEVQPEKAEKKNEQADNGKSVVFEDALLSNLNVVKISLDVLDPNEEIVGDLVDRENISSDKVFYVRPVLTLRSNESATYNLRIKIKNENGDVLHMANGNPNVTFEYGVDVKKKKEQNFEFPKFGSNKPGSWNKGVYKVEVYDGDIMLGRMQFTIE